jgi:hypothetical protein
MISLQWGHLRHTPSGIFTFLVSTGTIGAFVFLNQAISHLVGSFSTGVVTGELV